jgi:benzoate/toluate 1,2-dioxygenase beta subunit
MDSELKSMALELVQREALFLDEQRFAEWTELYVPDCVFWVPMWKADAKTTTDPNSELSFIYLDGIRYLEERVHRVTSRRAVSSMPIPRTSHLVGPGLVSSSDAGKTAIVQSAWRSQVYLHKDNQTIEYAGRYTHTVEFDGTTYRIKQKKIFLNCDYLQSKLDFFYI